MTVAVTPRPRPAPATVNVAEWTDIRTAYLQYWEIASGEWAHTTFAGVPVLKLPTDLWVYQELLCRVRPDVLVETGTCAGGSAYYFAGLMALIGHGQVLSIDVAPWPSPLMPADVVDALGRRPRPEHPRITYITGSSVDDAVLAQVRQACAGQRVLVILDSDHSRKHVLRELDLYAPLVTPGSYLVVEDTGLTAETNPLQGDALGAAAALAEWLPAHPEFEPDPHCERFLLTSSPGGYLRRKG